jgi:hypothetical protein
MVLINSDDGNKAQSGSLTGVSHHLQKALSLVSVISLRVCDIASTGSELGSLAGSYVESDDTSGFKTAGKYYHLLVANGRLCYEFSWLHVITSDIMQ